MSAVLSIPWSPWPAVDRAIAGPLCRSLTRSSRPSLVTRMTEEPRLVDAARRGDRSAFARLHELHAAMVHGILLSNVPRFEVDDLVQDVFLQAMRRLADLRDGDAFGPWVAAIARNRAHDFHRRRRKVGELPEADVMPAPTGDSARAAAEASEALTAIRSLPEAYRETLVLRLVEGLSGPEIAERTGLTHGSVRVNLHRGMQLLRERLAPPRMAQ